VSLSSDSDDHETNDVDDVKNGLKELNSLLEIELTHASYDARVGEQVKKARERGQQEKITSLEQWTSAQTRLKTELKELNTALEAEIMSARIDRERMKESKGARSIENEAEVSKKMMAWEEAQTQLKEAREIWEVHATKKVEAWNEAQRELRDGFKQVNADLEQEVLAANPNAINR